VAAETVSHGFGLGRPGWRASLDVVRTVFIARLKIIFRYRLAILSETVMPVVFAALPILLGTAVAGGSETQAANNFFSYTRIVGKGPEDFRLYMLIGSNTFMLVSLMLWLVGYWVRREQETGTLEALYLSPAKRIYILAGVTSYTLVRALLAFGTAMAIGSIIFGVNPLSGNVGAAMGYFLLGIPALWGISFFFGALVMRMKEANAVIQLLQWILAFAMGIYFPVTVFPAALQYTAMAFPPTPMNDAMRSSFLNIPSLYGDWYVVVALMFMAAWSVPLLGYEFFLRTERRIKRDQGVGQF